MSTAASYPSLDHLVQGYLHQDLDLVHGTEEAAVAAFAEAEGPEAARRLREEIERFRREEAGRLRAAFIDRYRYDFDPGPTDADVDAFLTAVDATLER